MCMVVVRWVINCNMPLGSRQQMMTGTKYSKCMQTSRERQLLPLFPRSPDPCLCSSAAQLLSLSLFHSISSALFCAAQYAMKNSRTMRSMLIWPPKQQRKHKQIQRHTHTKAHTHKHTPRHTHTAKEVCHCLGVCVKVQVCAACNLAARRTIKKRCRLK